MFHYTQIRWLSSLKILKRLYTLRPEIIKFLEMKGQNTDEIKDESWLLDLAFCSITKDDN